ncbi:MAG: radical SAM family heme chaperone HemW, partial [Phycisphaerales bacterium]
MSEVVRQDVAAATRCALYVHVPFCTARCAYCDFCSEPVGEHDTAAVVDRICHEIKYRTARSLRPLNTIFLGGGTPTLLPPNELDALLAAISQAVGNGGVEEFSVEANPATVDIRKATLLTRRGVGRVSMGAQSFIAGELAMLERLHEPDDIHASLDILRRCGISQVNLDLIFGIPGQTLDTWSESLRRAVDLGVEHIATYGLTYEAGTRLTDRRSKGLITPCSEGLEADMYLRAIDFLAEHGYEQYEISNFAKPGCRCRHNLVYWLNQPYIGVGPSATGCDNQRRYKNIANVETYVRMIDEQGYAEAESEALDTPTVITELLMMQLRLIEGLSVDSFSQRVRIDPLKLFIRPLARLTELGLVT